MFAGIVHALTAPSQSLWLWMCCCRCCCCCCTDDTLLRYGVDSVAACTSGTFDPTSGVHLLGKAAHTLCWPLTVPVILAAPSSYEGVVECRKRNATAAALLHLFSTVHSSLQLMETVGLVAIAPEVVHAHSAAMSRWTCDGVPLVPEVSHSQTVLSRPFALISPCT